MLYRPPEPDTLWDCTVYVREGIFHIFYLAGGNIGHVSTGDFVEYHPYPPIEGYGAPGAWNENGLSLTGCLIEKDGGYLMLLGAIDPVDKQQVYGLYTSADLIAWTAHPQNPVLRADGEIYDNRPSARDWGMYCAWRDPMVYEEADGLYTLCLCARERTPEAGSTGAVVARVRTRDFIHYEYLPPLARVGDRVKYAECPDCFILDGNRYVLFLDHSWGGVRCHTPSRDNGAGTWYRIQPGCRGEFIRPEDDLLLGAAEDRQASWAARTVQADGERLLYSHVTAARPAFAPPKVIRADERGRLTLRYYPRLDALYGRTAGTALSPIPDDPGQWCERDGVVDGACAGWGSSAVVADEAANICLTASVTVKTAARAGYAFRCVPAGEDIRGVTVLLDVENQRIELSELFYRPGEGFGRACGDVVNGGLVRDGDYKRLALERGREYALRVMLHSEFFEVYVDDEWVITKAMASAAPTGAVQTVVERGDAVFSHEIRLMRNQL